MPLASSCATSFRAFARHFPLTPDISLLRDKRRERLDVSVPEGANSPSSARRGIMQHDLGNLQIVAITAFA